MRRNAERRKRNHTVLSSNDIFPLSRVLNNYETISDNLLSRISNTLMMDNDRSRYLHDVLPEIFAIINMAPLIQINQLLYAFFNNFELILEHNVSSCVRCISSLTQRFTIEVDPALADTLIDCILKIDLTKVTSLEWWNILWAIFRIKKVDVDLGRMDKVVTTCWEYGYHRIVIMAEMIKITDD